MRIKRIILAILGEKRYLSLLGNVFPLVYRTGLLTREYRDIYFLRKFVREGDWCVDIGAHLGYFTLELGRLVKDSGKVYAVEPMSKFNKVLESLLERYRMKNVTLLKMAVGGNGEYVEMGIPEVGHMKKFAYARVMDSSPHLQFVESEKVKNDTGDHLFGDLGRLDFIKCDVEGLEVQVFGSFLETLKSHHPVVLCEIGDINSGIKLYEMLTPLGYSVYRLEAGKLYPLDVYAGKYMVSENSYFIPAERMDRLKNFIIR